MGTAVGGHMPVITLAVGPLASGVLAESEVTGWNTAGQPTSGLIIISPDASGNGWYIDRPGAGNSAFTQALSATAMAAQPGSAAYGEYDLLTALEHEIGHIVAFDPSNTGYAAHLETIGGAQEFVGSGFTAQVTSGGELDPNLYPNDVMAANLAPGVRKLPATLELDVVSTLWGTSLIPLPQPAAGSQPGSTTTTAVDHAIAALGSTASPVAPVSASNPTAKHPAKSKKAIRPKPHHGTTKVNPDKSSHDRKSHPHVVSKPSATKTKRMPDASVAVQLASRGAMPKPGHHGPKKD